MKYLLSDILKEYSEKNSLNKYYPVAVGKYGIRKRSDIYKKELAKDYSKNKVIRKNTLIVGMGSTQIDIGVLSSDEIFSVSPAYHTFNISDKIVDSRYLDLLFLSKNNEYTQKYMIASARQGKTVNLKDLLKEIIEIPNFEQQYEIINKIEKIKKFIQFEEENISYYEELIKSRFIEMFGDINDNPNQYPILKFTDVADIDCNMIHNFEKYQDYPHIGIDCIEKDTGNILPYKTIKEDGVISGKYLFNSKHIIYSKIRPNLNKVALPNFEGLCSADSYPILVKENICNRLFFAYILRGNYFLNYILPFSSRANMPKVNQVQLSGFSLPVPPIELQNEFAEFVQLIDKLKFDDYSKYFLCEILTFISSTIAYSRVVSIFVCPKRC